MAPTLICTSIVLGTLFFCVCLFLLFHMSFLFFQWFWGSERSFSRPVGHLDDHFRSLGGSWSHFWALGGITSTIFWGLGDSEKLREAKRSEKGDQKEARRRPGEAQGGPGEAQGPSKGPWLTLIGLNWGGVPNGSKIHVPEDPEDWRTWELGV